MIDRIEISVDQATNDVVDRLELAAEEVMRPIHEELAGLRRELEAMRDAVGRIEKATGPQLSALQENSEALKAVLTMLESTTHDGSKDSGRGGSKGGPDQQRSNAQ